MPQEASESLSRLTRIWAAALILYGREEIIATRLMRLKHNLGSIPFNCVRDEIATERAENLFMALVHGAFL